MIIIPVKKKNYSEEPNLYKFSYLSSKELEERARNSFDQNFKILYFSKKDFIPLILHP